MKYTRYDMKRKKNDGVVFIVVIASILIVAVLVGTVMSKVIFKDASKSANSKPPAKTSSANDQAKTDKTVKYVALQGGFFANKDYAENNKNTLKAYGMPFAIQEGDNTRVFCGIYSEQDADKMLKLLAENNVKASKMTFQFTTKDVCDAEIYAIIDGNLQILSKAGEKDVKAIPTDAFKKWCSELQEVDKKSKNYKQLEDLKNHAKNMPKEMSKDKVSDNYSFLYGVLKALSGQ